MKLSVLLFYRRIFSTPRFRLLNDIMICLIVLWTATFLLAEIFVCGVNPKILWTYETSEEKSCHCINTSMVLLWFAVTDVIGDFAVLAIPWKPVQILQKSRKEKIGIISIFMLGAL